MFNPFQQEDPALEKAIADAYYDLEDLDAQSKAYKSAVAQIVKLNSMRPKRIDPNTLLIVLGNIYIGHKVLKHEQTGVIVTKLWQFLSKV